MNDNTTYEPWADKSSAAFIIQNSSLKGLTLGFALFFRNYRKSGIKNDPLESKVRFTITLFETLECEQLLSLESLLLQHTPEVCYYPAGLEKEQFFSLKRLNVVAENMIKSDEPCAEPGKTDVLFSPVNDRFFDVLANNLENKIAALQNKPGKRKLTSEFEGISVGLSALSALFSAEADLKDASAGDVEFVVGNLSEYMRLDSIALRSLNVFTSAEGTLEGSVFGLLNHCKTKTIGAKMLRNFILQPLTCLIKIQDRQAIVQNFVSNPEKLETIRRELNGFGDIEKLVTKLASKNLSLAELYVLYLFARSLPTLVKALEKEDSGQFLSSASGSENKDDPRPLLHIITKLKESLGLRKLTKYTQLIEALLDFEHVPREFRVASEHDESGGLSALNTELQNVDDKMLEERSRLENSVLDGLQAKFETEDKFLKSYGWHYRINKKHDNIVKQFPDDSYIYLKVVNACIRWTSAQLQSLYTRRSELNKEIDIVQKQIVQDALEVASTFVPLFRFVLEYVALIDVLSTFAYVATHSISSYTCPKLHEMNSIQGKFKIINSRHPCVENLENINFIPNDFHLDNTSKLQVITGPNMGGKSTYIRQLAILCILAQIGAFIPAESAEMVIVDAVFVRVGADDDFFKGQSTFMIEMAESASLLKSSTHNSLAIVDEIGRGTSTAEGFGIAYAIAKQIAAVNKCYCLFATHFHELAELHDEFHDFLPNPIVNKFFDAASENVDDNDGKLIMLYKLKDGVCNRSYGINIARACRFPESVIRTAVEKLHDLEDMYRLKSVEDTNTTLSLLVDALAANDSETSMIKLFHR